MKQLLLFLSLVIVAGCSRAQTKSISENIPPYRILKTDSTFATPADLKKNRPVMLIYFSPDCPHCQRLMYEIRPKIKSFGDMQIVMITWSNNFDIRAIKTFYHDFDLKKYPNIIVGTEGYTYTVQKYFQIETTPYIAVYNRSGKMVKGFAKAPTIEDLLAAVKKAE